MRRSKAAVVARGFVLLAVAAATTNPLIIGFCAFALMRTLERHWEVLP